MLTLLAAVVLPLTLGSPVSQTFTVDDDKPADFVGIAEAIASASVQNGDVLLVAAGSYGGFTLDKALHILPLADASYWVDSIAVAGPAFFSLVAARTKRLDVAHVAGRAVIDRCEVRSVYIDGDVWYAIGETTIDNCDQLLIQRSFFRGTDACYTYVSDAETAVMVTDSTVTFTDSFLRGGDEAGLGCSIHYPTAGSALIVRMGSEVLLVDSTLISGVSSYYGSPPALSVNTSSVTVRGNRRDFLQVPYGNPVIALDAASSVVVSGVGMSNPVLPSAVSVPAIAEPFLRVTSAPGPGGPLNVELYGAAGAVALVAFGTSKAPRVYPITGDLLWLDGASVFLARHVQARGQNSAASFSLLLPWGTGFAGTSVTIQAWVGGAGGTWLTNAFEYVATG